MHRYLTIFFLLLSALLAGCSAKAKLEKHTGRADRFFEEGDFQRARIEYLNALQLDRNDAHVATRLGECFLKEGDATRAYQLFSHALAIQPTNNEARIKLASVLLLGGEPAKARQNAAEVLKASPLNPDALLIFANASLQTNDLTDAFARFTSLASANPANSSVHLGLAITAQRIGSHDAAEASFKRAVELEPKSARNHFSLGSFYFARGDTNNAGIHLKTAMELSPVKSVERLGYAEFQIKTGQAQSAEATLIEAATKHPEFTSAWNMLTQLAFAQGNTNGAAEFITEALENSPQDRDALLNRSRLKTAGRDFKSALEDLQSLANKNPRDPQVQFQIAVVHAASQDPVQALLALEKTISANPNHVDAHLFRARLQIARSDWNNAISDLNQLIRRFPNLLQAYYMLAAAHRALGDLDDAIQVYTRISKAFPKDPQPFQLIGTALVEKKMLAEARKAFEEALKVNPDYLAAIDSLTDLDIAEERFDSAIKRVNFYHEKYPQSPLPPLLLGKVMFRQQKNPEAEAAFQKAIAIQSEFTPAHRALAEFYRITGQSDKAISKYEALLANEEKDVGSRIQLGMLLDAKGDYTRALQNYQAVLKYNPNSIPALNNIAYIFSERLGKEDEAIQYARRARDLAPHEGYAADTLGWILWKKGQFPEAIGLLQQAAEDLPAEPEVQYHLGMAQYMMGNIQAATASLSKAVQSTNTFVGKDRAADALAVLQIDPSKSSPAMIAQAERHSAQYPNDVFAQVQLARLYEGAGNWNIARTIYEAQLAKHPKHTLLLSGLASLHVGPLKQPDRAMELARQSWAVSQSSANAAALGAIAFQAGDYRWANGRLIEAVRAQASPEVLYYKGLTSFMLGYMLQARDELSRAVQSNKLGKEKALLAKAGADLSRFHLGEIKADEAQRAIQQAVSADPNFAPAAVALGLIAEQKGDFTGARKSYETALQRWPGMLLAQRQLAVLLAEKLADDAAAYNLATALRQDFPDDPALSRVLGKIAYRREDFREAVRFLGSAASRQSTDSDLLYHLGMAQYRIKDQSAKASLNKAISLNPNAPFVADAKKTLAELN